MPDAHLLKALQNPTNKNDKQTKSNKKLKHVHFSPIVFVKLVIPSGKKDIQTKNQLVKAIVDSVYSDSIIAKSKVYKLPVKKTKQEQKWSTDAGVLTTNTKTATSFSFSELHSNKLIHQSLHLVDINIDRYDMITVFDLIRSLGIDIHVAYKTIHWGDAAIPWRNIDSTKNDVFALSQ